MSSTTTQTAELLARVSFLSGLDRPSLERLAAKLPERQIPKGHTLFREGDPCEGAWIVTGGSINVLKMSPDGRTMLLETHRPADSFALVPAIDGGAYPACAEAREDSRALLFPTADLVELCLARPAIALALTRAFAAKLRALTGRVAGAALQDVRARVAAFLVQQAEARGSKAPDGAITFVLDAPQGEIASKLGTVREVLARALRAFRETKLIRQESATVSVLDLEGLKAIARGTPRAGGAAPNHFAVQTG